MTQLFVLFSFVCGHNWLELVVLLEPEGQWTLTEFASGFEI